MGEFRSQSVTDKFIDLRFDISGIKNRDSIKEIGIEFTGKLQQKQTGFVSIELVSFVKNLSELTQEQKPTEDHDTTSPTENNQSNMDGGKETEENKVEKTDSSISPLGVDKTQIKAKENSVETKDSNRPEQKRNLPNTGDAKNLSELTQEQNPTEDHDTTSPTENNQSNMGGGKETEENKVEKTDSSISPLDVDKTQIKEKENSVEIKDSNKPEQQRNLPNTGEKKRNGLFELGSIFLLFLTFLVARMKRLTSGKM